MLRGSFATWFLGSTGCNKSLAPQYGLASDAGIFAESSAAHPSRKQLQQTAAEQSLPHSEMH